MRMLSILIIIATLLVTPGCAPGIWNSSQVPAIDSQSQRTLREGTSLDDLDLSGLKVQEVKAKLKSWEEDKLAEKLLLVYNKTEIPVTRKELGISLDFEKIWAQLWTDQGQRIASSLKLDSVQTHQMLNEKLAQFNQAAVDASYTIENNQFIIKPAVPGRVIQEDPILEQLQNRSFTELPSQIEITASEVPASQTTEQLQALAFDGIIGEYTTRFNVNDENRSTNLKLAANKMDKSLLKPGDILSFNQTVGQRTLESGYKDAYVIINNEYVQGVGGGICQVSSTLYSAAVLADLPIVERYPHAMAISYIPLGQDATVSYPDLDLKFKNDSPSLIYIRTEVKPGVLTVRLYGKKTGKTVRFEQQIEKETDFQTIRRIDPNLAPGQVVQDQAGYKGFTVKTYRVIKDSTGALNKQLLTQDEYAPTSKILRIGAD